ncbi:MAG: DUF349 domain-containing protein [Acidobacteria bacterium]|nr:DUF349 domain-containing protein [Acidobacteriota bacterium]
MAMGLLDLLKSQPKWKHPDRAVRVLAVDEIPDEEQDVLFAVAREDEDRQVRRAAVTRLVDPAALAEIARADQDADVRDAARDRVAAMARDERDEAKAGALLDACLTLPDPAVLVWLAREAALERVARGAFERLRDTSPDARVFSGLARQSDHPSIRLEALGELSDERDLVSVALRTDLKEVGLTALERVSSRDHLEAVATRAKNKVVGRRAKAILREQDERQQEQARAQAAWAEAHRQRMFELCRAAEALRSRATVVTESGEWSQMVDELSGLEADWQTLDAPIDEALAARFGAAADAVKGARSIHEQHLAEEAQRLVERSRALTARREVYDRLEALPAPHPSDGGNDEALAASVAALAREFEALGPATDPEAAALTERFHQRHAAWLGALARRQSARSARPPLEQILQELEQLARGDQAPDPAHIARLHKAWTRVSPDPELHADLVLRAAEIQQRVETRLAEARELREKEERANAVRLSQLCTRLEAAATAEGMPLKQAERLARDARAAIEQPGPFPSKRDHDATLERLKQAHARLAPRLKELREADDWQRWANAGMQEELCRRAEALLEVPDVDAAWRQSRDLFGEWKKVATAPRDRGQALWSRFKSAQDRIREKCEAHFAQQAAERAGNAAHKLALCARAEALQDSTDWIRTAEEIKRLQAEWKTIGPVPRGQEKAIWDRFRSACDRFFTRRHDDLVHRKQEWAANLARKEALSARAEALGESTEWEAAAAEIKRLQAEWKTVGPVRKNKSEAVWQRFRAAIDRFYERYHQRHRVEEAAKAAGREAVCAELEELGRAAQASTVSRDDLLSRLRALRSRWVQAPVIDGPDGVRLDERYHAAFDAALTTGAAILEGSELDAIDNQRKMEKLCSRVESLVETSGGGAGSSPVSILAAQLREALAANTIGGRVSDESRWRASLDEVRNAQAAWRCIGPVPRHVERNLSNRFRRACNRFFDEFRRRQAGQTA